MPKLYGKVPKQVEKQIHTIKQCFSEMEVTWNKKMSAVLLPYQYFTTSEAFISILEDTINIPWYNTVQPSTPQIIPCNTFLYRLYCSMRAGTFQYRNDSSMRAGKFQYRIWQSHSTVALLFQPWRIQREKIKSVVKETGACHLSRLKI